MITNRYDGLQGDWAEYARVARKFVGARWASIPPDDADDLVQRLILAMHHVGQKKGLEPGGWLWTTAHYELCHYWRERSHQPHVSLNEQHDNGDGKGRELWETIAARAVDLEAQMDAKIWLEGCPDRVKTIARKQVEGNILTERESGYMSWWRQRVGIRQPFSDQRAASSEAQEVKLPPPRVTVYAAICAVLARNCAPLHERQITELVAAAYPPLVDSVKGNFHRRIHTTLIKRRNTVFRRVAPATWILAGRPQPHTM